ncbi:MAG: hypothetical protein JRG89_04295 [Deltaproteobacteria bacterium]|nr:hypothetical protein [Deltaproteobacteria bacterium]
MVTQVEAAKTLYIQIEQIQIADVGAGQLERTLVPSSRDIVTTAAGVIVFDFECSSHQITNGVQPGSHSGQTQSGDRAPWIAQ